MKERCAEAARSALIMRLVTRITPVRLASIIIYQQSLSSLLPAFVCLLCCFSPFWLFATLWTVTRQAPLSLGFSRQEYWSGFPCPPPGDLPVPGIKDTSLTAPALAGGFFTTSTTWEAESKLWSSGEGEKEMWKAMLWIGQFEFWPIKSRCDEERMKIFQ